MFYRKNTQVRQSVIFVLQEIVSGKHVIKKKGWNHQKTEWNKQSKLETDVNM